MSERAAQPERRGFGGVAGGCFALFMAAAMATLGAVLFQECGAGREAVETYVASVRAGEAVSEAVAGDEAAALTETLRGSERMSVSNFIGQAGTVCYWVTVSGGGAETDMAFLLGEGDDGYEVVGASSRRRCECPHRAHDQPCRLLP